MKPCPKCGTNVSDTAKFCVKCGFNIKKHEEELANREYFCAECGTKFSGGTFCPECGYDVSADLSADDSSSSSIGTIDPGFDFSAINDMAQDQLYEKEGFVVENGILTGYTGKKRILTIPGSIDEIYDGAFENNELISFVELQEGTKIIGKRAFANCTSLVKINIPASVKKVFDDTFEGVNLETLVLAKPDMSMILPCLSEIAKKHFKEEDLESYLSQEGGQTAVDVKAIEESTSKRIGKVLSDGIAQGSFTFGSYYQSNAETKDPIEWIVLEKDEKKALMISKYALDAMPFDDKGRYDWSSSSLRAWLNGKFIECAFNAEEQKFISTQGDRLFCLDVEQVQKYFSSVKDRICIPTAYAMGKNPHSNGNYCNWWTCTYYYHDNKHTIRNVSTTGNWGAYSKTASLLGVRPAIWVNLDL